MNTAKLKQCHVDLVCSLLEDFAWDHRAEIPQGWAPQTLLEANVPYEAIFEALYTLREAGVSTGVASIQRVKQAIDLTLLSRLAVSFFFSSSNRHTTPRIGSWLS